MKNITVRKYSKADLEPISKLMLDLQKHFTKIDSHNVEKNFKNLTEAKKYIDQAVNDCQRMNGAIFVAEHNSNIVGFIQGVIVEHKGDTFHQLTKVEGLEGWIGLMFVDDAYRGKKIGKMLLSEIRDYFISKNCRSIHLKTSSENKKALEFYHHNGFVNSNLELIYQC